MHPVHRRVELVRQGSTHMLQEVVVGMDMVETAQADAVLEVLHTEEGILSLATVLV